jgi:hypothetical protein
MFVIRGIIYVHPVFFFKVDAVTRNVPGNNQVAVLYI